MKFVGCRAKFGLELEGREVGFVDFAEVEGIGGEPFASFDFDIIAYGAWLAKYSLPHGQQL